MNAKGTVLICDDDEKTTYFLEQILEKQGGHKVIKTHTGEECLEKWNKSVDLVICDIKLPGIDGMEVLKKIKEQDHNAVVIMATGYSTESLVISALRSGSYNYIKKPYQIEYLLSCVAEGVLESWNRKESLANKNGKAPLKKGKEFNYQSDSPVVQNIYQTIEKVAQKNISILLTGESGTGKEFFAQLVHKFSNRSAENLVPVNCPAIPATLAESELFGHEKGSFTGADSMKIGKFELANKGIIFLDEIADLSLEVQAKLLRVLQEREVYRVGGLKPIPIDVLLISATSKDLRAEIDAGNFRPDLYYRIADINIEVPRLQDRTEDIPALVKGFVNDYCSENNEGNKFFSQDALNLMKNYSWPGNIRELKSFVRRVLILSSDSEIKRSDIESHFSGQLIESSSPTPPQKIHQDSSNITEASTTASTPTSGNMKDMEKEMIQQSINECNHNLTEVAKKLGISRSTLYRKIKKYGIEV